MPVPLLATKFHIPSQQAGLIPRPQLLSKLNAGLAGKLILVSAPAGFGKTTTVTSWLPTLASTAHRVVWLSLDERDNDVSRFLLYFIAALQQADARIGAELRDTLETAAPAQFDALLVPLINDLSASEQSIILVLDDYHMVNNVDIHQLLHFIIDNQPPNLTLVITSRDEPFLPLSRLRARRQMVDIRAQDLSFAPAETETYLNTIMGLGLKETQVRALSDRTEGWITGLHLAALSLQQHADPAQFISAFAGDHRYIIDYLVDEVLSRRSEHLRQFLLHTSILSRLNARLCEAVSQQADAHNLLQQLEQENIFIIPLDDRREWYRYHHLFADVLRMRLAESQSESDIAALHLAASHWYEDNAFPIEAIEHALKAADTTRVIDLIENNAEWLFLNSHVTTVISWYEQLPRHSIHSRPRLCLIYAWAFVSTGQSEAAEACLQAVEREIGLSLTRLMQGKDFANTVDAPVIGALLEVAVIRAQMAIARVDIAATLALTGFALPYLEQSDCPYIHNHPSGSLMAGSYIRGAALLQTRDLDGAEQAFSQAGMLAEMASHIHIMAMVYGRKAQIQAIRGDLEQALQTCTQGIAKVQQMAGEHSPLAGFLLAVFGTLLYEKNELDTAEQILQQAICVAKPWGNLEALNPACTALAQLYTAQEKWQAAHATLDALLELGRHQPMLVEIPCEVARAMIWSGQGEHELVQQWLQHTELDPETACFIHESELIKLAHILINEQQYQKADKLISRLLADTRAAQRAWHTIKLLALQAILYQTQHKTTLAQQSLEQALAMSNGQAYYRSFVDLGNAMRNLLLTATSSNHQMPNKLLAAFGHTIPGETAPSPSKLVEALSERELEVLRLLPSELSGPEIAQRLMIAVSTLRTHTQQIYRKLGVKNRRSAVHEAERLNLL